MPIFYTLDRTNSLSAATTINLAIYKDITPPELQLHVQKMFPDGVSVFGERYLLRSKSDPRSSEPAIEFIFEYVRRANFPERPSRFQSVFGFESLVQVTEFRSRFGGGQGVIWELESEEYFRADMNLLRLETSILLCSYLANEYWAGKPDKDPFWEILLVPPVRVLREIQIETDQS